MKRLPEVFTFSQANTKTVTVETTDGSIEIKPNENLLEALLDYGCAVEYQCCSGYCGSCRTKIISGQVDYDEMPLAHVGDDEILPCCCRVNEPIQLAVQFREFDHDKQGSLFNELAQDSVKQSE